MGTSFTDSDNYQWAKTYIDSLGIEAQVISAGGEAIIVYLQTETLKFNNIQEFTAFSEGVQAALNGEIKKEKKYDGNLREI